MRCFIFLLLLSACGRSPTAPISEPTGDAYTTAADRALGMADDGWIVSRYDDGTAEHQGDSLLWTGMAMGVLDCERGAVPEAALLKMIGETNGAFYRHPGLRDRETSMDGALGLFWGLARRLRLCPATAERWADPLARYQAADSPQIPAEFSAIRDLAFCKVGIGVCPSDKRLLALEAEVTAWAAGVRVGHSACFRIHLGYLALSAADAFQRPPSASGRHSFCDVASHLGLANVDEWCGHGGLADWLAAFTPDRSEYAFQRCKWESENPSPNLHTPGIDELEALATLATAQ